MTIHRTSLEHRNSAFPALHLCHAAVMLLAGQALREGWIGPRTARGPM
jgi:hypothetical protein